MNKLQEKHLEILGRQEIEVPSWAFGNTGTRFRVFGQPGVPRDPFEKISDAAQVHGFSGLAPRVALHIPWDKVSKFSDLKKHAEDNGVSLGTVNSNTFQDDDFKLGSLAHSDKATRQKAIDHHLECLDIMNQIESKDLKIWLADGTNYPGQDDMRIRQDNLADSLQKIYSQLGAEQRLVLEYKFFEPSFYHTDVPDWGTALLQVQALGEKAVVCLDTGHHAQATNIEFIVMQLSRAEKLGSFDFNSRFYADDDLIVGAADPFQLYRIMFEVLRAGAMEAQSSVVFMLDQAHNLELKIPAQLRSVLNVQEATAKALLVDQQTLRDAQLSGDVLAAHDIFMDAYNTDVREQLADWRVGRGLPADPVAAFRESGYLETIAEQRVGGEQAGWGA